jgi:hypothetical protein
MNERSWERLGAASGLAAAVLLLVGLLLAPAAPGLEARATTIIDYLDARRAAILASCLLVTLAVVAFLWFVAHLRHVLQRAESGVEAFSPVVLVSGVSLATATLFGVLPLTTLAVLSRRPLVLAEGGSAHALYGMHQLSLGPIGLLVALFAASAGVAMVRRELAGPWLGWLGLIVAAIGLIAGITSFSAAAPTFLIFLTYATGITFALWVATASVVMLRYPEVERVTTPRAVFAR